MLIKILHQATTGNNEYTNELEQLEDRHIRAIDKLIPKEKRGEIVSKTKETLNELEDLCRGVFLIGESSSKTKDIVLSFGERLSSPIVEYKLRIEGINSLWIDSRKLLKTDDNFGNARILKKETQQAIDNHLPRSYEVVVLPGFIASTLKGETATLGRGGSDYTASIIAAGVDATVLEIWTDVSGVYSADPRVVKTAMPMNRISYEEAMELSHFGAKVIYAPTVQPVKEKKYPYLHSEYLFCSGYRNRHQQHPIQQRASHQGHHLRYGREYHQPFRTGND